MKKNRLVSSRTEYVPKDNYSCNLVNILFDTHKKITDIYSTDIKALKSLRDTKIANSDKKAIKILPTTWEKIDELSIYVTEYLDIVEHTFLTISRSIDSDSKRYGNSLKRMLSQLE